MKAIIKMPRPFYRLLAILVLLTINWAAISQQRVIQGNWSTKANTYQGKIGDRFTFRFPAQGTISGSLWGTDLYTDDGSIASAAVHAGLITARSGGTVTIEIRAAAASYRGSTRNGVTSNNWGSFSGKSFVFITDNSAPSQVTNSVIKGEWNTKASVYRGRNGERFTFRFPARGIISSSLWGTDLYTDDGSIATAAVHAGLITARNGGTVTIEIRAGAASYRGSTRNGVTSGNWGSFLGSFVFVR